MQNIRFGQSSPCSARNNEKFFEYFSPVYLATLVLQQGINPDLDQIDKYGSLKDSFDFSLISEVRA